MQVEIRQEVATDAEAIDQINAMAFEGFAEPELVRALRSDDAMVLSLVADESGDLVGHVAFSLVTIDDPEFSGLVVALGPMSVVPSCQRAGVGSKLVVEGLRRLAAAGCSAVVVLGHPDYYPRFGFSRADGFGLRCEFRAPPESFMALELIENALQGLDALVTYHPAFGAE